MNEELVRQIEAEIEALELRLADTIRELMDVMDDPKEAAFLRGRRNAVNEKIKAAQARLFEAYGE